MRRRETLAQRRARRSGRPVIITAALCWWNELPEDLDRCIRGIANAADRVVALDGAYARYPYATSSSPKEQYAAIRAAARDTGLECTIVKPERVWDGQVQKRSHLLRLATEGSDWILTVDADHVIHTKKEEFRHALLGHRSDVFTVPYITPANPDRPMKESAVGLWHEEQVTSEVIVPHIWRALQDMRVEKLHWWYSAIKDGKRHWLWGGDGTYPWVNHSRLNVDYKVEHRTMMRTPEQIKASRAFLNDRIWVVEQTGQEDDLPTLPRPKYKYNWVPV